MLNSLIQTYFHKNLSHEEIKDILFKNHGIVTSVTTVKRRFSSMNLRRKYYKESSLVDIVTAVVEEFYSSGFNLGYRSLWAKLKKEYNLTVKRETVYRILKIADPEGVANRYGNKLHRREYLSPGPNFLWHLDGYDKLKQFGFAIHGCIDGFSRYLLWLEAATTNNDPKVTANYYLRTIKALKLLPTIIRSDKGSENVVIERLQKCLRSDHADDFAGDASFIKGRSVSNQRIECYWGQMRKHTADFYIQLFKSMQQRNEYDGSDLQKKCLQFCFGPLIRYDLNLTKKLWNEHRIRKQAARNNISGKPYVMYHLPARFNASDYKKEVDIAAVENYLTTSTKKPILIDPQFQELVDLILPNATVAASPDEALSLYTKILSLIREFKEQNRI